MDNYLTNSEICEIIRKIINILNNDNNIVNPEQETLQFPRIARYTVRGPDFQWFNNNDILDNGLGIFMNDSNAMNNYNINVINFNMFSWYCLYDFIPYVVDIYNKYKNDIGYNETNKIKYINGYPDLRYASNNGMLEYYLIMFIKTL